MGKKFKDALKDGLDEVIKLIAAFRGYNEAQTKALRTLIEWHARLGEWRRQLLLGTEALVKMGLLGGAALMGLGASLYGFVRQGLAASTAGWPPRTNTMTNDGMPNDEGMTNTEARMTNRVGGRSALLRHSGFVIRISFVIPSLVIPSF